MTCASPSGSVIPLITNGGVGDVEGILREVDAGYVVPDFSDKELDRGAQMIPTLLEKDPQQVRNRSRPYFDLTAAVATYGSIYDRLQRNV